MCAFWLLLLVCPYSTSHLRHSLSFESTICPSHQIIVYVVCIYNPVLCMKNISSNKREGRRFLKNTSFRIMCCERSNQMARDTVNPIRNVFDSIVQISSTIYVCVVQCLIRRDIFVQLAEMIQYRSSRLSPSLVRIQLLLPLPLHAKVRAYQLYQ